MTTIIKNDGNILLGHVSTWVLVLWGAVVCLGLFDGSLLGVIGSLIGLAVTGPECVRAAVKYGRSPNWAFFAGGFFNFIGWGMYWAYLKLKGDL